MERPVAIHLVARRGLHCAVVKPRLENMIYTQSLLHCREDLVHSSGIYQGVTFAQFKTLLAVWCVPTEKYNLHLQPNTRVFKNRNDGIANHSQLQKDLIGKLFKIQQKINEELTIFRLDNLVSLLREIFLSSPPDTFTFYKNDWKKIA